MNASEVSRYAEFCQFRREVLRVSTRVGHRWNVLHGFVTKEPEQVLAWPFFAAAITSSGTSATCSAPS